MESDASVPAAAGEAPGVPVDTEAAAVEPSEISSMWSYNDLDEAISTQESARQRAEERRERHRDVQRRFAQRKKEKLQLDRALHQKLEVMYKLLSLTSEQQQLAEKNADLARSSLSYTLATPPKHVIHSILQSHIDAVRDSYEPLSEPQWAELLQLSLQDYEMSRWQRHGVWATTGASIMGWRDRISLEGSAIKLAMEKDFERLDANEFADRAWERLCSPAHHPRFLSLGLIVKMQVVQRINEDAVVICRCIYEPRTSEISILLEMFCRVLRGRDRIIISRTLENTAVQAMVESHQLRVHSSAAASPSQRWPQITSSFAFASRPNGGCRFQYGCWVRNYASSSTSYWMRELPVVIWRFEAVTVAPTFTLQDSEEEPCKR